uniref:SCP domain-containing protein n=1 Tax=Trichuris muris TaxID=70415 RepID=A0A5S6QXM4_TRIMR
MEEFIEDIYTGVNAYDYVQTTCLDAVPCQSFLSFAWFENTKIGCALATCQAVQGAPMAARQQYFGVCAYDRKADLTARPYVAPPSCQFCPNDASICSNNLCCPYDLNAMTCPSVGGVGAGSGGSPPDGLIDLYYISRTPSKIAYATNATEVQELITIGAVSHGIIGKVAAAGNDASKCGVLKPIYHLYSPHFRCNYYIVDEYLVRVRMDEGYEYKGILGYAVRGINACGASLAIYEFFRHSDGITQVPNSTDVLTMMSERSGYIYHGISFAVWR